MFLRLSTPPAFGGLTLPKDFSQISLESKRSIQTLDKPVNPPYTSPCAVLCRAQSLCLLELVQYGCSQNLPDKAQRLRPRWY